MPDAIADDQIISTDVNNNEHIDPRIQVELECLNKASTNINKLVNELEEAKEIFVLIEKRHNEQIEQLFRKLDSHIHRAKPYYEALETKETLQKETHEAVKDFQRAISNYTTVKSELASLEQTRNGEGDFVERLNETIMRVNNYKRTLDQTESYHRSKSIDYQMCVKHLNCLESNLRKSIEKSEPYYALKAQWNVQIEIHFNHLNDIERAIKNQKSIYSTAMNNLHSISDQIHQSRQTAMQCGESH